MKKIILIITFILSQNIYSSEFWDEAKQDATSPFNTPAINVLIVGSGLTLLTYVFKDTFREDLQQDVSSDRPLKRTSKIGDVLGHSVPNIAYALIMGSNYLLSKDQQSLDRTILMTKATLYSGVMTDILKRMVNEQRPNGGKLSFPSGHATTAFAFASVVGMQHSLPWGITSYAMASFVGLSRMNDNAHYLHDVIAGAAIGTMYGVGTYYAKKNRDESTSKPSVFMILPTNKGLMANYSFYY